MDLFTYIFICTQRDTREEVRRQFMGIYSFPNHVGSRNCTQVSRLGRKKKLPIKPSHWPESIIYTHIYKTGTLFK